jgi:hypothetical protein
MKDNSFQPDITPPQFCLSTELELDNDDYKEAIQKIKSGLPSESSVLHVQVISKGQTKTIYVDGLTEEDAFRQAQIPSGAKILERSMVRQATRQIVSIRASDEIDAQNKVWRQIYKKTGKRYSIKTLKLISKGLNWGLVRSQNRYQVEAIELAQVKIVYRTKEHLVVKTGNARAILKAILADDLADEQKLKRIQLFLAEIGKFKAGEVLALCRCGYPFGIREPKIQSISQSPMDVSFLDLETFLDSKDAHDNYYRSYFICPNCGNQVGETWIP